MSGESAFLSAIREAPEDDGPRLVFADWLEDHGDPARADFIRVQCELARLERDDERGAELKRREKQLLDENEGRWAEGLSDVAWGWQFARGLPDQVTLDQRKWW